MKGKAGDPHLPVAEWNRHVEASDAYHGRKALGEIIRPAHPHVLSTDVVKLKNGTGTALRAGEVVEFNTPALSTLSRQHPWFIAAVPDETRPFAILLHDVPSDANALGLAQISGRCPALVNVLDITDRWANVKSASDVLEGNRFGGDVRLLQTPSSTGEQLLWVNIQPFFEGVRTGVLAATLIAGGSASVNEIDLNASNEKVYTGRTFIVRDLKLNTGQSIDGGTIIDFAPMSGGRYKWIAAHCAVSNTLPE